MAKKRKTMQINQLMVIRQFAERIREVRRSVGFTQRHLDEKAHLLLLMLTTLLARLAGH